MKQIDIRIETVNSAFDDYPASELARILRELAERIEEDGIPPVSLYDSNGNRVGKVSVTE